MKNSLKKIGIIGLIIAVLSPFIELPRVNAETCEKHLQNYMFLDVNYFAALDNEGSTFLDQYIKVGDTSAAFGYQTYTRYPYAFTQNANSTIKINWIETNNFTNATNLDSSLTRYWTLSKTETKAYLSTPDYYKIKDLATTTPNGIIFVEDTSHIQANNEYIDNSIIFHGTWSSREMNGTETNIKEADIDYDKGKELSLQYVLDTDLTKMKVSFRPGTYNQESGFAIDGNYTTLNTQFFQDIVDGKVKSTYNGEPLVPIAITRYIEVESEAAKEEFLNNYIYGYIVNQDDGTKNVHIFTTNTDATKVSEIEDSYTALKNALKAGSEANYIATKKNWEEDVLDFDTTAKYYWPVVLTVEYSSCEDETVVSKWTIEYDDNVDDNSVIDTPDSQTENIGTDITVSSKKPTRNGYAFQKWCETSNGSGACYNAGDKVKSPTESTTVKLYAQWAKEGTEDNKKTGVVSYIIGFIAVGVVAGGIYLISKKKNLFKQI